MNLEPPFIRRVFVATAFASMLALAGCGGGGSDDSDDPVVPPPTTPVPLAAPTLAFSAPSATIDIANYIQTGRYSLPVGSGANLLAQEASAVTYNRDTNSLFIVGDGGTSIAQVDKKGVLIDSMTLGADPGQPQGTVFYDPEGIAYTGNGTFVIALERYRQVMQFKYLPNTTLTAADVKTVTLGTTIGNIGLEGISYDPATSGYLLAKEVTPSGLFQTTIDFTALTASNGSATTENSTNLFDPAKAGLTAFSDVFAFSNILPATAAQYQQFLIVSGPDGKVRQLDRSGAVIATLDVGVEPQNEGVAMDTDRNLYVVNEVGGGIGRPEMFVYAPTTAATAVGRNSSLYLTFAAAVTAGVGNLTLSNGAGDVRTIPVTDPQVVISGLTLAIHPASALLAGTPYSVTFAAGLVKDASGTNAASVSDTNTLRFTVVGTVDTSAPVLTNSAPAAGAIGANGAQVTLTFNEAVVAGTGSFVIGNGSDIRTIAVGDATQVSFAGSSVVIKPTIALAAASTYTVTAPAGVLKDAAGNVFAGIAASALSFSTAAAPPTVLAAGDILFMAANADAIDAFAVVLLKDVTPGTTIGFSDRDYSASTGFGIGESAYQWTADTAYAAGTLITVQVDMDPPLADKGTIMGKGGGVSTSAETLYAFQGTIAGLGATSAGAITPDRFLAAINLGAAAGDIPASLVTAGAYVSFAADNVRYAGSLDRSNLAAFAALVRDPMNWATNDATAYPLTGGSLFP
ncbi:hypothetical protein BH09PSE6_BH09PSE6_13020 [soil metagenome]